MEAIREMAILEAARADGSPIKKLLEQIPKTESAMERYQQEVARLKSELRRAYSP